jgi:putative ABC transport system ATP-binding protein
MTIIELRGVSDERHSLRNLDCALGRGDVLAISTMAGAEALILARILSLVEEFRGEFFLLGVAVHKLCAVARRVMRRAHLGVILRSDRLVPELTVRENLELPLTQRTRRADRDSLIDPVLEHLGLEELGESFPRQLSDRQLQLAKIARASVASPDLLVGEEISAGLRPSDWDRVVALLRRLRGEGAAVALTSIAEAREVAGGSGRPTSPPPTSRSSESISPYALSWVP